jgi:2,4-dienoyl-CoA reductase-like NADH-dependent reductase (Old Yellow Enzyme family)
MMPATNLDTPVTFTCGKSMKNRFMLAPMTNTQSHDDGTLSDDEFHWLSMRAKGQFGLVMTCASNVQRNGQGWPGELGIYADYQIPGHQRLVQEIQRHGSLAVVQIFHGGMRCPAEVIGEPPVCPSDNEEHQARGLSLAEVEQLRDDFIAAAVRAQKAGYDGVEIHGAHGYIITQFLSSEINKRTDKYGGSLDNRARLLFEITAGIRQACGQHFLLGIRLSPERFGMVTTEIKTLSQQLIDSGWIDFLDFSLWDVFKASGVSGQSMMEYFTSLDRKGVKFTVAGKIKGGSESQQVLEAGIDFVSIGKSAILHHDFPVKVIENPGFRPTQIPVSAAYLRKEGLSDNFINYIRNLPGFVEQEA